MDIYDLTINQLKRAISIKEQLSKLTNEIRTIFGDSNRSGRRSGKKAPWALRQRRRSQLAKKQGGRNCEALNERRVQLNRCAKLKGRVWVPLPVRNSRLGWTLIGRQKQITSYRYRINLRPNIDRIDVGRTTSGKKRIMRRGREKNCRCSAGNMAKLRRA